MSDSGRTAVAVEPPLEVEGERLMSDHVQYPDPAYESELEQGHTPGDGHDQGLGSDPEAGVDALQSESESEPEASAKKKRRVSLPRGNGFGVSKIKRETRFGIAALLSFVILVTVLLLNKQRGTGKGKLLAMELPPPKPASKGDSNPERKNPSKSKPAPDPDASAGNGSEQDPPAPTPPAADQTKVDPPAPSAAVEPAPDLPMPNPTGGGVLSDDKLREAGTGAVPPAASAPTSAELPDPMDQPSLPPLADAGAPSQSVPGESKKGAEVDLPAPAAADLGPTAGVGPKSDQNTTSATPPEPAAVAEATSGQPDPSVAPAQPSSPGDPSAGAGLGGLTEVPGTPLPPAVGAAAPELPGMAGTTDPASVPAPAAAPTEPSGSSGSGAPGETPALPGPAETPAPAPSADSKPESPGAPGETPALPGPAETPAPAPPADAKPEVAIPGGALAAEPGKMPETTAESAASPNGLPAPNEPAADTAAPTIPQAEQSAPTPAPAPAEAPAPSATAATPPPGDPAASPSTTEAPKPTDAASAGTSAPAVGAGDLPPLDRAPAADESGAATPPAPPMIKPGEGIPIPNAGKGHSLEDDLSSSLSLPSSSAAVSAGSAAGATKAKAEEEASAHESDSIIYRQHVVQRNENFWTISRHYYGSGRYYMALWKANSQTVSAPALLTVGQTIIIPAPEALDLRMIGATPPSGTSSSSSSGSPARGTTPVRRTSRSQPTQDDEAVDGAARSRSSEVELILPIDNSMLDRRRSSRSSDELDPPPDQRPQEPRPRYRVRAHDTLRSIARDMLNNPRRANEIYELNRDILEDDLVEGQILELPEDARTGRGGR